MKISEEPGFKLALLDFSSDCVTTVPYETVPATGMNTNVRD